MAVNHLTIQGRLTKDIEMRTTQSGISTCNFTLAWNEKRKDLDLVCFQTCKAWRGTAEFINKYMHDKGTEMIVEGTLETEKWTDKNGAERSANVLNVDKVHFCGSRKDGNAAQTGAENQTGQSETFQPLSAEDQGELPF